MRPFFGMLAAIPVLAFLFCVPTDAGAMGANPGPIRLPPGFHLDLFSGEVSGARSMALGDNGTLFVGTRREGTVYAVLDRNGDGKAEKVIVLARDLNMPNGVAFRDGALFVAEGSRVLRYDGIESRLTNPPRPVVVNDSFPRDAHHGWKFIRFGPDGKLYVPVGAPCNVCVREDPRYASIMRMNADGTGLEIFARGVRNTVGFDWHPETGEMWFTDNGRDWMGDDLPPDELNRAPRPGLHFGFPYWHGMRIPDPAFGGKMAPQAFVPPEVELGPHVAALGIRFYTGRMFPERYRNRIFIAEHGSWNRTEPVGYRVTVVGIGSGRPPEYAPFAEGWLRRGKAWGRPVDVLVLPDGSLLVSDDRRGAIYRIRYE